MVRKLEAAFRGTEKSHLALRGYRKDGSPFKCEFFITPLIEDDECTYVIAIQRPLAEGTATPVQGCGDEQARMLADALSEAVLVHQDNEPLFVNTAYVDLFGYASRDEATRELSPLMNLPLDRTGAGQPIRCDALRTDGLSLSLVVRAHSITWQGGPATLLTINRAPNTTRAAGRKAAGTAAPCVAPDDAELMRALLDSLPVILAHKTPNLRYTYVNKTYADWVDSTREQIVGTHVSNVRNESHYQMMKKRREDVLSGKVVQYSSTSTYPGRGMRDLQTTLIPHRNAKGEIIGYFSMAQDITELKEVERTLARREEQLRLVMDSVPALISYRDRNLRYHYVNQPYSDWFGVPREDMIGRYVHEFVELAVFREMKPIFDRVLAGERFRHTYRLDHIDPNKRPVVVDYVPHEDENGHIAGFFALAQALLTQSDSEDTLDDARSTRARNLPML
jgi:PAS domain S-box-containing protein